MTEILLIVTLNNQFNSTQLLNDMELIFNFPLKIVCFDLPIVLTERHFDQIRKHLFGKQYCNELM